MKLRKGKINIFFLVLFLHSDSLGNLNGFKYLTYIAMWLKLFCWFSTSLPPHLRPVLSSRTLSVVFPYQLHERGLKKLQAIFFSGYFYKVSKEGSGLKRVWLQHFQQFRNVSSDMASAIVTAYPSPQSLLQVQSRCNIRKPSPFAAILQ